ncbi:uncharacterized protein [Spinacia oleracea]|uniref:Reverse transcriptase domain-containing protein n=1 Tax=Spinacia oleracea TaxID=3562 RepID=A0ABM3RIF9_SPIOL|nr:uncharacterized protein LOC130469906 [Spinacia oleracea]
MNENRNWNGYRDGNFQGRINQGHNNKNSSDRVYHCKMFCNNHYGRNCKGDLVTCNHCQKKGYREYECFPKQKKEQNSNVSGNQGKSGYNQSENHSSKPVGYRTTRETTISLPMRTTTIIRLRVNWATYPFVSSSVVKILKLVDFEVIDLLVSMPTGVTIRYTKLFKNLHLKIRDCNFPSNLIEFSLGDLDVILGMHWLSLFKASIDCKIQKVSLRNPVGKLTSYRRLEKSKNLGIEDVPIVNEFLDVFPSEISEHDEHLSVILETLRKNQLYAKSSKCEFRLEKVVFLGHYVSKEVVFVDPANIQDVSKCPAPKNICV